MKREERIYVRLTTAEKQELEQTAEWYGYDVSDFLRRMTRWVRQTRPIMVVQPEPERDREREPA